MTQRPKSARFSVKISPSWARRIDPLDPNDPLLRQVQLSPEEEIDDPTLSDDPVGDLAATQLPGILQKYSGRVLINLWNECPIHCRFCFRRNLTPSQFVHLGHRLDPLLQLLKSDPSIHEVIFSGGDPMMATPSLIQRALEALTAIPSIRRLRFHTRVPIAAPEKISDSVLTLFQDLSLPVTWVLHTNHPREIDSEVQALLAHIRHQTPIHLLSQTVLLKGVNHQPETLISLFELLFEHGVLPYYLHLTDRAAGTHHFQLSQNEAERIFGAIQTQLPGYLVPRLVQERSGEPSKTLLTPQF